MHQNTICHFLALGGGYMRIYGISKVFKINFNFVGREAILLVKDAIEFCEPGENRNKTPAVQIEPASSKMPQKQIENNVIQSVEISRMTPVVETGNPTEILASTSEEFVPQFTDVQRQQLDEQLRCVSDFLSYFRYIYVLNNFYFIFSLVN